MSSEDVTMQRNYEAQPSLLKNLQKNLVGIFFLVSLLRNHKTKAYDKDFPSPLPPYEKDFLR